jgi:two-component system OmpR family response regulator
VAINLLLSNTTILSAICGKSRGRPTEKRAREYVSKLKPTIGPTILVVDADSSHRQAIRRTLRAEGYRVLEAADYGSAQNVQQQHRGQIALLLTGISLSGGNGYDLARTLIDLDPDLRVLFVSGEAGAKVSRYYKHSWAEVQTLSRPFGPADLLRRVELILELGGRGAEAC